MFRRFNTAKTYNLVNPIKPKSFFRFYTKYAKNDQIYIHPHSDNRYKVSFSPNEKSLPIGYTNSDENITPGNFESNQDFLKLLQGKIGKTVQNDFSFIIEAGANANTFMPIYDFRETPRYSRIPEIDNIFGYIQVDRNGKMIQGTYEENKMYRICNGTGLIKLSDYLYDELRKECEIRAT